jgi:CTP synthase
MIQLEAIRQFKGKYPYNTITIFLTYIPYLKLYDEFKIKPARDSIKSLYESGMVPDIIICRYEKIQIKQKFINKISIFSNIPEKRIFLSPNINNIYELPYMYIKQNMHMEILCLLDINKFKLNFKSLCNIYNIINNIKGHIHINIIGKQIYSNKYLPLIESLNHASYQLNKNIKINWIKLYHNSNNINIIKNKNHATIIVDTYDEIDISLKLSLIKYIRQNNIPCLGICNGMHLMLIEFIKQFSNIDINSLIIKNSKKILGYNKIKILPNTKAYNIYNSNIIKECHKHYSEINIKYKSDLEKNGLMFSGLSNKNKNIEILEVPSLNFYMGIQYFPEFNTSIFKPNKLICSFLKKAYKYQKKIV